LTLGTRFFFEVVAALRATGCRDAAFLTGLAALATRFFAGAKVFFVESFLGVARAKAFCALRTGGLAEAFAFGRAGLAFNARPLTDGLVAGRRAGVRDDERLNPFVMGLLMCGEASNLKDDNVSPKYLENAPSLTQLSL
jgi:hypothetical protein